MKIRFLTAVCLLGVLGACRPARPPRLGLEFAAGAAVFPKGSPTPSPLPSPGPAALTWPSPTPAVSLASVPVAPAPSVPVLLADGDVVYGPASVHVDVPGFLLYTDGSLRDYHETLLDTGLTPAAAIIGRVAWENSINPALLVAVLEYFCGCVQGPGSGKLENGTALGAPGPGRRSLYGQLAWAAGQLSAGYYGRRTESLVEVPLPDGTIWRPVPLSNAGSTALVYLLTQLWRAGRLASRADWEAAASADRGVPAVYRQLFPAEAQADGSGPNLPAGLEQPELALPFRPGETWSLTGGPHPAWDSLGGESGPATWAALDFAPPANQPGCTPSEAWVTAVASGPVVRLDTGLVVQDLDGPEGLADGLEQTGWAIVYMHIDDRERVPLGVRLQAGEPVGHPSCLGGRATGVHVHLSRKYNGEWIPAAGAIPFNLSGWIAQAGEQAYQGSLVQAGQVVTANVSGGAAAQIRRP